MTPEGRLDRAIKRQRRRDRQSALDRQLERETRREIERARQSYSFSSEPRKVAA